MAVRWWSLAGRPANDPAATNGLWLVDDGVPPSTVQRVVGHERSASTLDLYTPRMNDPTRILRALDDEEPEDPDDGPAGALVPA